MDPATAIGLASSTFDFVQASYEFLKLVYNVYNEKHSDYETMNLVAEKMEAACEKHISDCNNNRPLTQQESDVYDVASRSKEIATDLTKITRLEQFGRARLPAAIRNAVKLYFNKGRIHRLQKDLVNCREQYQLQRSLKAK